MESGDVAVSHDDKVMDNALVLDSDNGDDTVSDRWYEFSRVFTCEVVEYAAKSIDSALFADNDSGSEAVVVPCFVPIKVVMVVANLGSSFSAVASFLSVQGRRG